VWKDLSKPSTWAAYNGETQTVIGAAGISSVQKIATGRYRFFFTIPKISYVLSGSSSGNSLGYNTWICTVSKNVAFVDVGTCDTLPGLTYVDTLNLDVLVSAF